MDIAVLQHTIRHIVKLDRIIPKPVVFIPERLQLAVANDEICCCVRYAYTGDIRGDVEILDQEWVIRSTISGPPLANEISIARYVD